MGEGAFNDIREVKRPSQDLVSEISERSADFITKAAGYEPKESEIGSALCFAG